MPSTEASASLKMNKYASKQTISFSIDDILNSAKNEPKESRTNVDDNVTGWKVAGQGRGEKWTEALTVQRKSPNAMEQEGTTFKMYAFIVACPRDYLNW